MLTVCVSGSWIKGGMSAWTRIRTRSHDQHLQGAVLRSVCHGGGVQGYLL